MFTSGASCPLVTETGRPLSATATVIFGATGDLTHRKIVPAFYHLVKQGCWPEGSVIIGFARRPKTTEEFRAELREALGKFSHTQPIDEAAWRTLEQGIHYFQGDVEDVESYRKLAAFLPTLPGAKAFDDRLLFYLATAPTQFASVARHLATVGLSHKRGPDSIRRLIVEKPFGEDGASARELNAALQSAFEEEELFRIDHYLGKETVQNLLYLRFANSIYEPLWNRNYIDNVQITVAEKVGVEGRGGYYDVAGAARDMLQNHLLQLLALLAMEPPASLDAESIRDEKVKVLRSIPTPSPEDLLRNSVRAQYTAGSVEGRALPDYRAESRVDARSTTETYVALRLEIDNWRWSGVPFYLRTGKALAGAFTEINIAFRRPPSVLFAAAIGDRLKRNSLRIRIQPDEGITLGFNAKMPGKAQVQQAEMSFLYRSGGFAHYLPEAYERLLIDAFLGESTLFTRADEVEQAWRLVDALRAAWATQRVEKIPTYPAGSMGPVESDALLQRDNQYWVESEA